jgi:hypothetical protein
MTSMRAQVVGASKRMKMVMRLRGLKRMQTMAMRKEKKVNTGRIWMTKQKRTTMMRRGPTMRMTTS